MAVATVVARYGGGSPDELVVASLSEAELAVVTTIARLKRCSCIDCSRRHYSPDVLAVEAWSEVAFAVATAAARYD